MDRNQIANGGRAARKTMNIRESHTLLDPQYDVAIYSGKEITDTGLLEIGKVKPNAHISGEGLPSFRLRWDEKANILDVDALNAANGQINKFREGTAKYHGHHSTKAGQEGRAFEIDIVWNGRQIYRGRVGFNLGFEVVVADGLSLQDTVSYSVSEASRLSGLSPQYIRYLLSKGVMLGKKLGHDWIVLSLNYSRKRKPKDNG